MCTCVSGGKKGMYIIYVYICMCVLVIMYVR